MAAIQDRARTVAAEAWDRGLTPWETLAAVDKAFQGRHLRLRLLAIQAAARFIMFRDRTTTTTGRNER